PEPLEATSETKWRRWVNSRVERLVSEDIRDVSEIGKLNTLRIMADLLPSKVGSLFSANSMSDDLQVSGKSVSSRLPSFNNLYYTFEIKPYSTSMIKSLRRQSKVYLWDWSEVEDEAARKENLIASHLNKFKDYLLYSYGFKVELFYLRDAEGREVDFLMTL